jgi:hypothetical protein
MNERGTAMSSPENRTIAGRVRAARPAVVRVLLAGLLFEGCVLAGVLASPWLEGWRSPQPVLSEDPMALLVQWRHSLYRQEADPPVGDKAPRLSLQSSTGGRTDLADLRGKKVVLVFARDDGG